MQRSLWLLLLVTSTTLAACANHDASASAPPADMARATAPAAPQAAQAGPGGGQGEHAVARKIIRNAELHLTTGAPDEARARAAQIAEQAGGYVASSDVSQHGSGASQHQSVQLTLKVPSEKLSGVLAELRKLGDRVAHEKVTSQDVTEEYYDLEARLRTQRALEAQFLEIAKETRSVKDMLEVQQHLATVRGEIERMEGRRRVLDQQTSLSTVQVHLSREAALAEASVGDSVRKATEDARAVASGVLHGGIRLVGVALPLLVIFGPLLLVAMRLFRWAHRRARA